MKSCLLMLRMSGLKLSAPAYGEGGARRSCHGRVSAVYHRQGLAQLCPAEPSPANLPASAQHVQLQLLPVLCTGR